MITDTNLAVLRTPTCFECGKSGLLFVDRSDIDAYNDGTLVQYAFARLTVDLREQVISGTHPACWSAMFGDGDE